MTNKSTLILLFIMFDFLPLFAGEYHGQEDVICSDCHTTHYSERGTLPERAEPGGPFPDLLMVASVDHLCLSCHDGTDPAAPDVLAPVTMYAGSGSEYSGGGFFSSADGFYSGMGHDLGVDNQVPYAIPPRTKMLSCVSCHDPHGTANYRNLILNPDSLGADINLALNSDIFEFDHPQYPPERSASIRAYRSGNIGYKANMSAWCADCHTALLPNRTGDPPAHFLRHPSDAGLNIPGYHINSGHWVAGVGEGFGVAGGDATEGVPRLRFQAPNATDYNSAIAPGGNNQVICSTCHLAHGGPFEDGLTWPFRTSNAADIFSGCQQCHYK